MRAKSGLLLQALSKTPKNNLRKKPKTEQKLQSKNNARPISDVYPVCRIKVKSSLRPMPAESDNFEWYRP